MLFKMNCNVGNAIGGGGDEPLKATDVSINRYQTPKLGFWGSK